MSASLDDVVLTSFVADPEGFRDLDSVVRQRCHDIDPDATIEYIIIRNDSLRYETSDIEELLRERNGPETRLQSVTMTVKADSAAKDLKFTVRFDDHIEISGESDDRADLVLLASDVRALIRERMGGGRGSVSLSTRFTAAIVAAIIGAFGFLQFTNSYQNASDNSFNTQMNRSTIAENRTTRQQDAQTRSLISRYEAAKPSNIEAQLNFLTQVEVLQMRQGIVLDKQNMSTSLDNPPDPWWTNTLLLPFAIGFTFAGLALLASYLFYPSSRAIFLIGDQIRREARKAKIRERLIWGIGATFLLGLASGIAATAIH